MLLKGTLQRPPIGRLAGASIGYKRSVKYLGVTFSERLGVAEHVASVTHKARSAFSKVARLAGPAWGLGFNDLRAIYLGLFLGIWLYAMGAIYDLLKARDRRRLGSAQRSALITLCRAYKTASKTALQVIAGTLPAELEAARRNIAYRSRKGLLSPVLGQVTGEWGGRAELKRRLLDRWQAEWEAADTGRLAHRSFPEVRARMEAKWLVPSFPATQLMTGHGDFPANLHRFGLVNDPSCRWCAAPSGSAEHILRSCVRFRQERETLEAVVYPDGRGEEWPNYVANPTAFVAFKEFAEAALRVPATAVRRPPRYRADASESEGSDQPSDGT